MHQLIQHKHLVTEFVHRLPTPYAREIYLDSCFLAGTSYVPGAVDLLEAMEEGSVLLLLREPRNPYDEKAILVMTQDGEKLGYVPQGVNAIFARLLDAGKLLQAKLFSVERKNKHYAQVVIDLYLKD